MTIVKADGYADHDGRRFLDWLDEHADRCA